MMLQVHHLISTLGSLYMPTAPFSRLRPESPAFVLSRTRPILFQLSASVTDFDRGADLIVRSDRGSEHAVMNVSHTLKNDWVYYYMYATRTAVKASLFEYVEVFYNRKRRHS
jgi:hypothetical protein